MMPLRCRKLAHARLNSVCQHQPNFKPAVVRPNADSSEAHAFSKHQHVKSESMQFRDLTAPTNSRLLSRSFAGLAFAFVGVEIAFAEADGFRGYFY